MKRYTACLTIATLTLDFACPPVFATDNHTYKKHEYATIWHGRSPDNRFSIAAHGNGDDGYDNFHLYLMAQSSHRRIGPLPEIKDNLDTGPQSQIAYWSPDSRYVAILYRSDRRWLEIALYRVEKGKASPISVPSLMKAATIQENVPASAAPVWRTPDKLNTGVTVQKIYSRAELEKVLSDARASTKTFPYQFYRYLQFKWLSNSRFTLTDVEGFRSARPDFAKALPRFTHFEKNDLDPENHQAHTVYTWTDFAANAICDLGTGDKLNVGKMTPAPFDETIHYSPTLYVYKGVLENARTSLHIP